MCGVARSGGSEAGVGEGSPAIGEQGWRAVRGSGGGRELGAETLILNHGWPEGTGP